MVKKTTTIKGFFFLGVVFDRRLIWKAHICFPMKSCSCAMWVIQTTAHSAWGSDRAALFLCTFACSKLKYVCNTLLPRGLTYGCWTRFIKPYHLAISAFHVSYIDSFLWNTLETLLNVVMDELVMRAYARAQKLFELTMAAVSSQQIWRCLCTQKPPEVKLLFRKFFATFIWSL